MKCNMIKGFTAGTMDLGHTGHLMMLEDCRKQCDYLILGLQTDPTIDRPEKHKPIETYEERYTRMRACKYIDLIVKYETEKDLYDLLKIIKPDIRFIGEDHKGKPFTGDDLPIKIIYNPRNHNYSSSNLRERIKNS